MMGTLYKEIIKSLHEGGELAIKRFCDETTMLVWRECVSSGFRAIYNRAKAEDDVEVKMWVLIAITHLFEDEAEPSLMCIVKDGLGDGSSEVQEEAISVVEKWRTRECLDALRSATFRSPFLRGYAQDVVNELVAELS